MSETGTITHCTGFDRKQLQEIDIRVGAKLMEKEMFRAEYVRGFCNCLYFVAFVAWLIYLYHFRRED